MNSEDIITDKLKKRKVINGKERTDKDVKATEDEERIPHLVRYTGF